MKLLIILLKFDDYISLSAVILQHAFFSVEREDMSNFKDIVKEFNTRYNVIDIARDFEFELDGGGDSYRSKSIYAPGNNPTCTIYNVKEDFYYDFKEGKSGDALELLAVLGFNGNKVEALRSKGFTFDNSEYLIIRDRMQVEVKKNS